MDEQNDIQNGMSQNKLNLKQKAGAIVEGEGKTIQRAGVAMKYTGKATERTGQAVKQAGRGTEYAGKGVSAGGGAMMRAGVGLSETGLGAVVGVPLAAAGGVVYGAGKGVEYGGKGIKTAGKGVETGGAAAKNFGASTSRFGRTIKRAGAVVKGQGASAAEPQISTTTASMMISVAIMIDLVQFCVGFLDIILIGTPINWGIDICTWLLFYIWFRSIGISFSKPKRSLSFGIGFFIKLIPIINMLPAWTTAVIVVIGSTKTDKLGAIPGGGAVASVAQKMR